MDDHILSMILMNIDTLRDFQAILHSSARFILLVRYSKMLLYHLLHLRGWISKENVDFVVKDRQFYFRMLVSLARYNMKWNTFHDLIFSDICSIPKPLSNIHFSLVDTRYLVTLDRKAAHIYLIKDSPLILDSKWKFQCKNIRDLYFNLKPSPFITLHLLKQDTHLAQIFPISNLETPLDICGDGSISQTPEREFILHDIEDYSHEFSVKTITNTHLISVLDKEEDESLISLYDHQSGQVSFQATIPYRIISISYSKTTPLEADNTRSSNKECLIIGVSTRKYSGLLLLDIASSSTHLLYSNPNKKPICLLSNPRSHLISLSQHQNRYHERSILETTGISEHMLILATTRRKGWLLMHDIISKKDLAEIHVMDGNISVVGDNMHVLLLKVDHIYVIFSVLLNSLVHVFPKDVKRVSISDSHLAFIEKDELKIVSLYSLSIL